MGSGESYTLCRMSIVVLHKTTNGYGGGNTGFVANGSCMYNEWIGMFYRLLTAMRSPDNRSVKLNASAEIPSGSENNLCGAYQCSGYNFCWDSSNDCLEIDFVYSDTRTWNVYCLPQSRNPICFGVPSMYPYMKISGSLNQGSESRSCPAPVPMYEDCSCVFTWNGNSCFGCNYTGCNNRQIPGSGGAANSVFGGCNACGGDSGRMGMICVSWCCC